MTRFTRTGARMIRAVLAATVLFREANGEAGMRKGGEARHSFIERVIGALALREEMFGEVARDGGGNQHAIRALVLGGVGPALLGLYTYGPVGIPVFFIIFGLVTWPVYGVIVYLMATRLFETADTRRNLEGFSRGFAFAGLPRLVLALGFTDALAGIAAGIMILWFLAAAVLAIRASLDLKALRAFGAAGLGLVVAVVLFALSLQVWV